MLVLTRRPSEVIHIDAGGGINVTILGYHGNQVRVGIQADPSINIVREEIRGIPPKKSTAHRRKHIPDIGDINRFCRQPHPHTFPHDGITGI